MKKLFLVGAVALFGAMNAQETRFGAKAGVNLANVTGDLFESSDMKVGFYAGAFAEFKLSDKFAVQPELLFSMQGAKEEVSEGGMTYEGKLNTSYINIPIMAKFYATEQLSIMAGPQIGFLMSAEYEQSVSGEGIDESETTDVKDQLESMDLGINFGLGYDITENIFVDARYNIGLSNMIKDGDDFDMEAKNSVIQIGVGYKF